MSRKKYKYPEKTTIWLKRSTIDALKNIGGKKETYDDIVQRLLRIGVQREVDIFVDVLSVDGGNPKEHTIILQIGDFIYKYDGKRPDNEKFECLRRPTTIPATKIPVGVPNP